MSNTDISQLAGESLSAGTFPTGHKSPFRVFFALEAHTAIQTHGGEDTSVEICGVLVGQWQKDGDGPFATVSDIIRCDDATQGQAEVTFTHESWNHINAEMDSKYEDLRIVGWYHTHPDFGIFLSDRDVFIQEHFFGGPGQIALVVDPIRKLEGVFEWRSGKPTLMDHYWIGDRIESVAASRTPDATRLVNRERPGESVGATTAAGTVAPPQRDALSGVTTMMSWLCLFLLGWLLSGMTNNSRAYQSWAIERYGLWNIMQLGRYDELRLVRVDLEQIAAEMSELSGEHLSLAGEVEGDDAAKAAKDLRARWKKTRERLAIAQSNADRLISEYSLTPQEEQLALLAVVNELRSLRRPDLQMAMPVPVPERIYQEIQKRIFPPPPKAGDGEGQKPDGDTQPESTATGEKKPRPAGPAGPGLPPSGDKSNE